MTMRGLAGFHVVCALALLCACGDDGSSEAGVDPAELACEERAEAGTAITASSTRDDSAPLIEVGAEPYTVALPDGEPGYVRVEIESDTFALLLLEAESVATALYHEDEEEELVSAGPVDACAADIPEHFDIDFHEAGTYYLQLGPSALSEVWLLLSDGEGHGDGEHAHD